MIKALHAIHHTVLPTLMRQDQYLPSFVDTETEAQKGGASFPMVTQLVNNGAVIPAAIWL